MRTEPVQTEPASTEPARIEPIDPVVHRGFNGVEPVAASSVDPTRNEDMAPRTSDLNQPLQSKPSEP